MHFFVRQRGLPGTPRLPLLASRVHKPKLRNTPTLAKWQRTTLKAKLVLHCGGTCMLCELHSPLLRHLCSRGGVVKKLVCW